MGVIIICTFHDNQSAGLRADPDVKALIADMSVKTIMDELNNRQIECVACVTREEYAERLEMVWTAPNKKAHLEFLKNGQQRHRDTKEIMKIRHDLQRRGLLSNTSPEELDNMDADDLRKKLRELKRMKDAEAATKTEQARRKSQRAGAKNQIENEIKRPRNAKVTMSKREGKEGT